MEEERCRRTELLRAAKAGDKAAFDTFFEENKGLVRMVVSRFSGRGAEYDDLFQVACMAFVKAVAGFELSAGVQFSTYAVPVMLGGGAAVLPGQRGAARQPQHQGAGPQACGAAREPLLFAGQGAQREGAGRGFGDGA